MDRRGVGCGGKNVCVCVRVADVIGCSAVEGGRVPVARKLLRGRGEKVTVGVDSPQRISHSWLARRLSRNSDGSFVNAHSIYTPEQAELYRGQ